MSLFQSYTCFTNFSFSQIILEILKNLHRSCKNFTTFIVVLIKDLKKKNKTHCISLSFAWTQRLFIFMSCISLVTFEIPDYFKATFPVSISNSALVNHSCWQGSFSKNILKTSEICLHWSPQNFQIFPVALLWSPVWLVLKSSHT